MAAPSTYITVVKRFPYRGVANEEWSNSYAFTGSTPVDAAAWRAFFDLLTTEETKLYSASTSVIGGYGYDKIPAHGDHAIWSVDLTVAPNTVKPGSLANAGNPTFSGDQAAWVRWGLDRYNSRGKRVYLRKYFHDGQRGTSTPDVLAAAYTGPLDAFGTKMMDGTFAGGRKICDKNGAVPIGFARSAYVTTRTLKRRGKRPPT